MEYAWRYQIKEYLEYIDETLTHLYYSAMFDPIDGGIFREAEDYTFTRPTFEKNIYQNANAAILFSTAHKYLKRRIFKEAAERIVHFLEEQMLIPGKGYMTYMTLHSLPDDSTYYKYSLAELRQAFPLKYKSIAAKLGMDTSEESSVYQNIINTPKYWEILPSELEILKSIRYGRKNEVIYDKRVMTGYNCRTAVAFCTLARNSRKGERESYIQMAKEIIDNILRYRRKGKINLYKYISSTNVEYSISDLYDYSLFLNCVLHCHALTKDVKYMELAKTLTAYIIFNHYQPSTGMFTKTARYEPRIPVKRSPVIDYNTLSSNSIMADNLLLLHKMTGGNDIYIRTFKQQIYNIEPQLIGSGPFMTGWGMQVLNWLTEEPLLPAE